MNLNARAAIECREMLADAEALRIAVQASESGARLVDCGIDVPGGLEAGRRLAQLCLAGLGRVEFARSADELGGGLSLLVTTDQPVAACMASQYAGWRIAAGKYFAMGSGPMRAAAGKEVLFDAIGYREQTDAAIGILESRALPPADVCASLANDCGVAADQLTLFVAPTASLAGMVQVVARSVETALHKLFELGFDLKRIESASGTAPLPPAAADDLAAIGRTNDAILYGAEVTLWVRGDDASLATIGPRVPSSASSDYGATFATIFAKYNHDFYRIDPHLFSPASVLMANLDTGGAFRFGQLNPRIVRDSFGIISPSSSAAR